MKPFEHDGVFWNATNPSRQVGGRLRYDPAEGVSLSVVGMLIDAGMSYSEEDLLPFRANGFCGGAYVTLVDCQLTLRVMDGIDRSEYRAKAILRGHALTAEEEVSFDELDVRYDHLSHWANRESFTLATVNDSPTEPFAHPREVQISYKPQASERLKVNDVEIGINFEYSISGDRVTEMILAQQPQIEVRYEKTRSLDDILFDITCLQNLMTLGVDAPVVPTRIMVKRSDIAIEGQGDSALNIKVPIEVFVGNIAERVALPNPRSASQMLFTFDYVGGLDGVARWLTLSRKYRVVLGSLLTLQYSASLYEENRFLNAISAAESFHRTRFPDSLAQPMNEFKSYKRRMLKAVKKSLGTSSKLWLADQLEHSNEIRLSGRIDELTKFAGHKTFTQDAELWTQVVTLARNRMSHHDEREPFLRSPGDLHILAESVYLLVVLCLLRECELNEAQLSAINEPMRVRKLRRDTDKVVMRLSAFLRRRPK